MATQAIKALEVRLSTAVLRENRIRLIEGWRALHEIARQYPDSLLAQRRGDGHLAANRDYPPPGGVASLGTLDKDAEDWIEDRRCPFCPPYNLPLTATQEQIDAVLL